MELAKEVHARFKYVQSLELLPAYLLPADSADRGWVDVDGNLGICEKLVVRAYVELCLAGIESRSPEASLLSLIATTEHLSVVNSRKRFCLAGTVQPSEELHILDVLLSSHLYKHTKSPLLWSHRRWLVETFMLETTLEHEWAVVSAAALRHPRNYYAWAYMRWWVTHTDVKSSKELGRLVEITGALCRQNLSDVSMWSFLSWLDVPELNELAKRTDAEMPGHEAILASLHRHADSTLNLKRVM